MRAYLLGQASEAEAARLEERLLEDEDVFLTLRSVEDDLFDQFARNTLSAAERERFVERYGKERGRLLVAHAFANRTPAARVLAHRRFERRLWLPLAAAAVLAAAIAGTLMRPARPTPPPAAVPAAAAGHDARQPAAPTAAPAILLLTLGNSRAPAAAPEVAIPADAPAVELRIRIDPADRFDTYGVELRNQSDTPVWTGAVRGPEVVDGQLLLKGTVPQNLLAAGTYEVSVRGLAPSRPEELLGFATVTIRR